MQNNRDCHFLVFDLTTLYAPFCCWAYIYILRLACDRPAEYTTIESVKVDLEINSMTIVALLLEFNFCGNSKFYQEIL